MAQSRVVPVFVERVVCDTGLWCNVCLLSTGARVWFTTTMAGVMVLRSNAFCTDCGGRDVRDDT